MRNLLLSILCCVSLSFSLLTFSQVQTPHKIIQVATDSLLKEIPLAKDYFDLESERFYIVVDSVLSPVVDFNSFTRSVMGPFGQRDYYASLSAEQRKVFKQEYVLFVATFKQGLVQTYAKGLLVFDGQDITITEPTEDDKLLIKEGKPVVVVQTIKSDSDTYVLRYRMMINKKGEWVIRNVVMGSINVGQLYQNQFLSSMKKHENSFSDVISTWISETKDTDFKGDSAAEESIE